MSEISLHQPQPEPQRASQTARRFRMPRIIAALMLREMATTYGKSAGGYIWAILEPVLGIALLTVIFSLTLARPALGTNFALFYATGFLPFTMMLDMSQKVASSITYSRPFLAYPSVTFIDAMIARILLNALTHITVFAIVICAIFVIYQLPVVIDLGAVFEGLLMIIATAIGIGTLNCYLTNAFPIWLRAWQILTRPLFLISGIFFLYDMMPMNAQAILWYNPIIHGISKLRQGIYPTYDASFVDATYVFVLSLVLLLLGLIFLARNHRDMLER